jgi:putative FmdB family regulatory protein
MAIIPPVKQASGIAMPFYEYECPSCAFHEEVLQKITDKPLKKCPSCGKNGLKKLMSAPVFRLKGSGWYETDFKSDKENKRNLAGADKEEAPSKDKGEDKKTEAKPEAKPDTAAKPEKSGSAKPAPVTRKTAPKKKPAKKARR